MSDKPLCKRRSCNNNKEGRCVSGLDENNCYMTTRNYFSVNNGYDNLKENKMDKTSLGDRMKQNYENVSRIMLTKRMPLIIRLDGCAFHTLTKKLDKPFDIGFKDCMLETANFLVENIMGCKLAYVQSDEISLLITDYDTIETDAWYGKNLQKIVSVSASMATMKFNDVYNKYVPEEKRIKEYGLFDSRAFIIPKEEVCNYFLFRQNDATRNSIQGLGQAHFSHKQIQGVNNNDLQDKLMVEKGINWNDIEPYFKRGGCVIKDDMITVVTDIPQFSKDRNYIERYVYIKDVDSLNRKTRARASHLLDGVEENKGGIEKVGDMKIDGNEINVNINEEAGE